MKKILIYFYLVYKGDWDKIFDAIQRKERVEIEELNSVVPSSEGYVTILDNEYPHDMKQTYKPAFVLSEIDLNNLNQRKEDLKEISTLFNYVNDVYEDAGYETEYFDGYGNITDFGRETFFRYKNIMLKSNELGLNVMNSSDMVELENLINRKFKNQFEIQQNKKDIDLMA